MDDTERALEEELKNRDDAIEWADRLAYSIAPESVIGEHSSMNNPWWNALEAAEELHAVLRGERVRASQLAAENEKLQRIVDDWRAFLAALEPDDEEVRVGVVSSTQPEEYDEMKTELGPDTSRVPTEADQLLAGTLSTIWPMDTRHPSDALHLAIFVNDELDAAMSAMAESVSSRAAKETP